MNNGNRTLYYHVTPTKNARAIYKQGLRRFCPSHWVRAGDGERYGEGRIFAFTHTHDALRWAAHMDWELHRATGTGKISIVMFYAGLPELWAVDESDQLSQLGRHGQWMVSDYPVGSAQIIESIKVDTRALREIMAT